MMYIVKHLTKHQTAFQPMFISPLKLLAGNFHMFPEHCRGGVPSERHCTCPLESLTKSSCFIQRSIVENVFLCDEVFHRLVAPLGTVAQTPWVMCTDTSCDLFAKCQYLIASTWFLQLLVSGCQVQSQVQHFFARTTQTNDLHMYLFLSSGKVCVKMSCPS